MRIFHHRHGRDQRCRQNWHVAAIKLSYDFLVSDQQKLFLFLLGFVFLCQDIVSGKRQGTAAETRQTGSNSMHTIFMRSAARPSRFTQNSNANKYLPSSLQANAKNETKRSVPKANTNKKAVVRRLMKMSPSITTITTLEKQPTKNIALTADRVRERIAGFTLCARVVCFCVLCFVCLATVPLLLDTQEKRHCAVAEGYVLRGVNAECKTSDEELAP